METKTYKYKDEYRIPSLNQFVSKTDLDAEITILPHFVPVTIQDLDFQHHNYVVLVLYIQGVEVRGHCSNKLWGMTT